MSNIKVISSEIEPVYSETNVYYTQLAADGIMFNAPTNGQSVAANGYLSYQLTVPANINKTVYISLIAGGSASAFSVSEFKNAYLSGTGTTITPVNTNWDYSGGSACTVKYVSQATDPKSGGTLAQTLIGTGGTLAYTVDGRIVIPSTSAEQTFYLRVTNRSALTNLCALTVTWWEI